MRRCNSHGRRQRKWPQRLGLDRSTATNSLRLLHLPPEVQEMITHGDNSSATPARLGLDSAAAQIQLAHLIVKQGLSVRQVETLVTLRGTKRTEKKGAAGGSQA